MFSKIFFILEHHALGMGLILCLLIILSDKKAIERINSKFIYKLGFYISIIIYYLLIIIEIIQQFVQAY